MTQLYSVSYVTNPGGITEDAPVTDLLRVPVSTISPVRIPRSYKGQLHLGGKYLFETTGQHVIFESRLEQDALRFLDHQRSVLQVAAQPIMLKFSFNGKNYVHYPDFLIERQCQRNLLMNVRTKAYVSTPQAVRAFSAAQSLADALGWDYETWSEPLTAMNLNLRFLGGFRFRPYGFLDLAPQLLRACDQPIRLDDLCERARPEVLVRPVLFHLLWTRCVRSPAWPPPLSLSGHSRSFLSGSLSASHELRSV
ncbi:TnsA-like heteromeric transposase endonuclease subunit, partial [Deinococcus aquiradiocola]|uniref:TnsA-like heteromeric transposase endonuclease subunit n=1 Tax=Deinococcus aquiradiocola TaxID=393059 RepID=UPI001663F5B5